MFLIYFSDLTAVVNLLATRAHIERKENKRNEIGPKINLIEEVYGELLHHRI